MVPRLSDSIFAGYQLLKMFSKISWSQFTIFLAVILHLYYIVIAAKYYPKEILLFIGRITGKKPEAPGVNDRTP
jgi:hypothetical protein